MVNLIKALSVYLEVLVHIPVEFKLFFFNFIILAVPMLHFFAIIPSLIFHEITKGLRFNVYGLSTCKFSTPYDKWFAL